MGRNHFVRPKSGTSKFIVQGDIWCSKRSPYAHADWLTMRFDEIATQKPLSPEQARLKSMKDRVKRDQEAIKAERARQQIVKAQKNLLKL